MGITAAVVLCMFKVTSFLLPIPCESNDDYEIDNITGVCFGVSTSAYSMRSSECGDSGWDRAPVETRGWMCEEGPHALHRCRKPSPTSHRYLYTMTNINRILLIKSGRAEKR
jgi:hypothetical protein